MEIKVRTEDLVSVADAAKELGRPRVTIYRWIEASKIVGIKLGAVLFIPKSEVERLKNKQSHPGNPRNIMGLLPKIEKVLREYSKQTNLGG